MCVCVCVCVCVHACVRVCVVIVVVVVAALRCIVLSVLLFGGSREVSGSFIDGTPEMFSADGTCEQKLVYW